MRIAAAEALLASLPDNEQPKQRRHIARLKRTFTLGPEGLRKAAEREHTEAVPRFSRKAILTASAPPAGN